MPAHRRFPRRLSILVAAVLAAVILVPAVASARPIDDTPIPVSAQGTTAPTSTAPLPERVTDHQPATTTTDAEPAPTAATTKATAEESSAIELPLVFAGVLLLAALAFGSCIVSGVFPRPRVPQRHA